jgi:adenosylcobinamide-GDP ribazoletransferase
MTPTGGNTPHTPSEIEVALDELRAAAAFLTRLPARMVGYDPRQAPDFRHGARVFPVVGAMIGLAAGLVLAIAMGLGVGSLAAATLAVGTTALITGGLHEDGLADTADSFGGDTTEKKLAIMDDSRVGTYGALALVFSVLLRVAPLAAIASTKPLHALFALIGAEAVSRAALVRLWHDLPAARTGGLSNDAGTPNNNAMLIAMAIGAAIAIVVCVPSIGLWATILGGAFAALATFSFIRLIGHTLGGRTGDSLGACQQIAVAAFLIGASVS